MGSVMAMVELPDVLVCGVGGALGEAWMRGVLNGASDGAGLDFRRCEHFVGSSAGSIVTAVLAAGQRPDAGAKAAAAWSEAAGDAEAPALPDPVPSGGPARAAVRFAGRAGAAALTPVVPLALAAGAPGRALLRATALRAVPRGGRSLGRLGDIIDGFGPRFDGRLRIAAVDRASGRRVLFGAPGAPVATVRAAVLASCAVPGVFPPVRIAARDYVDGGVWSPTNLDAAPATRGSRVLCLVPTSASRALRAPTAAALATETLALRARGAEVRAIRPDAASTEAIGGNLMDPRNRAAVLAAGYAQGRRLATAG
jgi:NTE family protein